MIHDTSYKFHEIYTLRSRYSWIDTYFITDGISTTGLKIMQLVLCSLLIEAETNISDDHLYMCISLQDLLVWRSTVDNIT